MKRVKMKKKKVEKWYRRIKPIVIKGEKHVFLRELKGKELRKKGYTWFNEEEDYGPEVDYSRLSVLADVKMLHGYRYYMYFEPTVQEVIRQIPDKLLKKTIAFELIYNPTSMVDLGIFKKEFNYGYNVSVIRLYKIRKETEEAARPIEKYPEKESKKPIGMTKKEFKKLKEKS